MTVEPRITVETATAEHAKIVGLLGTFILLWSTFDLMLEAIIKRQLEIDADRTAIITTGLGFERKLSIARALLSLHGETYAGTISHLSHIVKIAQRNVLLHGHIHIHDGVFEFIKMNTSTKPTASALRMDVNKFNKALNDISYVMLCIQQELELPESDMDAIASVGRALASTASQRGSGPRQPRITKTKNRRSG